MSKLTTGGVRGIHTMVRTDPYTPPSTHRYECTSCLSRFESETHVADCPDCGSPVQNVAVPRE